MAAVRYGRISLVVTLSRHNPGNHFSKCNASTSVSTSQQDREKLRAWSGQRGVEVPRKKIIPRNAVLKSLKDSVAIDWKTNSLYPCDTLELAPTSIGSKRNSLIASQRAKEAVELLANGSELLTKGMTWVGETKAHLDCIQIPSGEEKADGTKTVSQIVDDLVTEQDLQKFHLGYQAMLKDGTEISKEMKEKIVAAACFVATTNISKIENIAVLEEILNLSAPLTKSMMLAVIQCYVKFNNEGKYTKWFETLINDEEYLDSVTASSLLRISNSSSLKSRVLDMLKSRGIPPTASGVLALFPYEDATEMTTLEIMELLNKYIQEANCCSSNTELEVLVETLSLVSQNLMNTSIMYALLSRIESFGTEKVLNSEGFVEALIAADMSRDVELAHKIVTTACRHSTSLPQRFFGIYVFSVGKWSTSEAFMENIVGYLGPVSNINGRLFERIVNLCSRRQWPHVLPVLFSTFDNPMLNHRSYTSWLQCASKLVDYADKDCLTQFKSISEILVNFVKAQPTRSSPEFRTSLVDLMVKCNHKDGLRAFLQSAVKNPSLKKEYSYTTCEIALKTIM